MQKDCRNNPCHALIADGAFSESGAFGLLPPILGALLVEQLRHAVLDYLREDEAITEDFASKLRAWEHSGAARHGE